MSAKVSGNSRYYSRIIVSKGLRFTLALAVTAAMGAVAYLLAQNQANHGSWMAIMPPVLLIGLGLVCIPIIEGWEYRPWQNAPMRYEHNA